MWWGKMKIARILYRGTRLMSNHLGPRIINITVNIKFLFHQLSKLIFSILSTSQRDVISISPSVRAKTEVFIILISFNLSFLPLSHPPQTHLSLVTNFSPNRIVSYAEYLGHDRDNPIDGIINYKIPNVKPT